MDLDELIKVARDWASSPAATIFSIETATAAPRSSNTIETVVEVGRPNVLYISSKITSVSMTARKMIMISEK